MDYASSLVAGFKASLVRPNALNELPSFSRTVDLGRYFSETIASELRGASPPVTEMSERERRGVDLDVERARGKEGRNYRNWEAGRQAEEMLNRIMEECRKEEEEKNRKEGWVSEEFIDPLDIITAEVKITLSGTKYRAKKVEPVFSPTTLTYQPVIPEHRYSRPEPDTTTLLQLSHIHTSGGHPYPHVDSYLFPSDELGNRTGNKLREKHGIPLTIFDPEQVKQMPVAKKKSFIDSISDGLLGK